ncbi:MAG: hydrogenase expression/formation protein HypE [Planctomycetales bacterium]|nr:hydrogenase expression/formation protein HypE [Planctomycetales bacterium]
MDDPGSPQPEGLSCPLPIARYPRVLLAHGGGGGLMQQLIQEVFLPSFRNSALEARADSAVVDFDADKLAFTTDSYVVQPLFFPGGDIGSLAVNGTVNDLAMCGARPLYLSVGLILEEGLPMETLWRVVQSMAAAASQADVALVTGDTKVVDRGKGDGLFVNTAGVGQVVASQPVEPASVRPGDAIVLSGDIGRHGIAIMAEREGLAFETTIHSDCAPLASLVLALLEAGCQVHCLRDLTRGGLAAALVEIADTVRRRLHIEETKIPVHPQVQAACEILGFDPLYVANEGRCVAFVAAEHVERALSVMRGNPLGEGAAVIGHVHDEEDPLVTMTSRIGATRIVDLPSGEQLPRIC